MERQELNRLSIAEKKSKCNEFRNDLRRMNKTGQTVELQNTSTNIKCTETRPTTKLKKEKFI